MSMADQLKLAGKLLKPVVKEEKKRDSPRGGQKVNILSLAAQMNAAINKKRKKIKVKNCDCSDSDCDCSSDESDDESD